MKNKIAILGIGLAIFFFFIFFSYLIDNDFFTRFDFDTTVRLQDNVSRRFDGLFSFFSDIGSFEFVFVFLLLFLIFRRKILGVLSIGLFALFHVIEIYGKTTVEQLPPPEFLLRTKKIIEFPQFHIRQEFSYPSGHAGRAAFISALLILFILGSKKLKPVHKWMLLGAIVFYDVVMFVSRVYLGEHWVTDVIGGILLGGSLGLIAHLFFGLKLTKRP